MRVHPRLAFFLDLVNVSQVDGLNTITGLKTQKRDRNRVNVFLDGDYSFGLAAIIAAPLRIGQQLSEEAIAGLKRRDAIERAVHSAMRLISVRPRSIAEVEQRLGKKGYDEDIAGEAVAKLRDLELLDDEAFALYWLEQRETFKPRGRRAIQHELRLKGISPDLIETTLSGFDELDAARRAAQKRPGRWDKLPHREFQVKLSQFLARRGFDYGTIKEVTNETSPTGAEDSDEIDW